MAKAKKLTKKMLDILDKGELRKIAIISMGLVPGEAYSKDEKELLEWIYGKPEEFRSASLDEIEAKFVRGGILSYVSNLQAYLRGDTTVVPKWPLDEDAVAIVQGIKEPTGPPKVIPDPPAVQHPPGGGIFRKTKSLRKKVEAKKKAAPSLTTVDNEAKDEVAKERYPGTEIAAIAAGASDNLSTCNLPAVDIHASLIKVSELVDSRTETFNSNLETIVRNILELHNKLNMLRTEQALNMASMSNALLYLLNSAVQDEGEEFASLSDVPKVVEEIEE